MVEERTRRLDEATRELLCYATAEGEDFTTYVLSRLAHKEPLALLRELKKAEKLAIIKEKGTKRVGANQTTTIFGFSHALFHKALYNALKSEERAILHRSCFDLMKLDWEEESDINAKALLAPKLLVHAEKCHEYLFAAEAALDAAKTFWGHFSSDEANGMLGKILMYGDIVNSSDGDSYRRHFLKRFLPDAFHLPGAIDDVHGKFDSANEWFGKAESLAHANGEEQKALDAANGHIQVLVHRGLHLQVLQFAELSYDNALKLHYEKGILVASNFIGIAASELGNQQRALECFQRSLEFSERNNDTQEQMRALIYIGNVYRSLGSFEAALQNYNRCLLLCDTYGARYSKASALQNIGMVYIIQNKFDDALRRFQECMGECEVIGDTLMKAMTLRNIGEAFIGRGEYTLAEKNFKEALYVSREIGAND